MQANNMFVLVGRLTKNAELKDGKSGKFLNLAIAIDRPPKKDAEGKIMTDPNTGRTINDADFPYATLWNEKQAVALAPILGKGSQISIAGQIRTRVSGEGEARRQYTDLRIEDLRILEARKVGSGEAQEEAGADQSAADVAATDTSDGSKVEEEF
jgi:single-stranded DNA-binding protein